MPSSSLTAPARTVRVRVPSTTANLGPGFDCLGMALRLYNTLELTALGEVSSAQGQPPAGTAEVTITGEGAAKLARDRGHLVLQAADALAERAGLRVEGWRLVQHNAIPLARGLGSSSAAIVGGLVACNEALQLGWGAEALLALANEIEGHPDNVAPALHGGLTVSCVSAGVLDCLHFPPPDGLRAALAIPDFEVSTEQARRALPREIPYADGVYNTCHAAMTIASLMSGRLEVLARAMQDRLHQPYRAHLVPGLELACRAALGTGAQGAALSGSGPTIIAFATEGTDAIAEAMQAALAGVGVNARTLVVEADALGAQVEAG
jgi:homoserine kinase